MRTREDPRDLVEVADGGGRAAASVFVAAEPQEAGDLLGDAGGTLRGRGGEVCGGHGEPSSRARIAA